MVVCTMHISWTLEKNELGQWLNLQYYKQTRDIIMKKMIFGINQIWQIYSTKWIDNLRVLVLLHYNLRRLILKIVEKDGE